MVYNMYMPRKRGINVKTRNSKGKKLVKIGELASLFSVLPSTINFYTREGILLEDGRSQGGYRLYDPEKALKLLKKIDYLQNSKRLTLEEIKKIIYYFQSLPCLKAGRFIYNNTNMRKKAKIFISPSKFCKASRCKKKKKSFWKKLYSIFF